MRPLYASLALLVLAAPASWAQQEEPERIREVLAGENATVVFSPNGGYSPQNYLKRFTNSQTGQAEWATQEGAVAEMIRRSQPNTKARIGSFRLSDSSVVLDALFEVAETKNVEVKLWLKGPPGLTYMVDGHHAIAARANRYLRRRAQEGKQAEWGDFQVMIGTEDLMDDFGKVNDMHEKFGVFNVNPTHAPGFNNAFLGTSNLSSSSDLYHNEHRIILHSNPKATQRLWGEFKRLWDNLGECQTYLEGDESKGLNLTPETARITLPGGGSADEDPSDTLQFRFTYEKRKGNSFHRISQDFVEALGESDQLQAGAVVWVAQFGFQIGSITSAIERAARDNPQVQFRIMVHTKEGEGSSARRLARAGLPNLQVRVKWDSNKLILSKGQRPQLPDHGDPMPALLHHKSLVLGQRVMITGSFNFFGDADSQGENVVIIRNHLDPAYAHLVDDAHAEFQALWDSPVFFDVAKLHGDDGLLDTIDRLSDEDGFLETLRAVSNTARTAAQIHEQVQGQPNLDQVTLDQVTGWLQTLTEFEFVDRDADDRYRLHGDPDVMAHARKPLVRERAVEGPKAGSVSGKLSRSVNGDLQLETSTQTLWIVGDNELVDTLWELTGHRVTLAGSVDKVGEELEPTALESPQLAWVKGAASQDNGALRFTLAGTPREVSGPAASVVGRAEVGQEIEVRAYVWEDEAFVTSVRAWPNRSSRVDYKWQPVGRIEKDTPVEILRLGFSGYTKIRLPDGASGYVRSSYLDLSRTQAGMLQALPGSGQ